MGGWRLRSWPPRVLTWACVTGATPAMAASSATTSGCVWCRWSIAAVMYRAFQSWTALTRSWRHQCVTAMVVFVGRDLRARPDDEVAAHRAQAFAFVELAGDAGALDGVGAVAEHDNRG